MASPSPSGDYVLGIRARDQAGNVVERSHAAGHRGLGRAGGVDRLGAHRPAADHSRRRGVPRRARAQHWPDGAAHRRARPGLRLQLVRQYASIEDHRFAEHAGYWRVGLNWSGSTDTNGATYPYRWGFGRDLQPGEEVDRARAASRSSTSRTSWSSSPVWSRKTSPSTALARAWSESPSRPRRSTCAAPRVSALIVSYNTRDLLLEAIASVVDEPGVETIVVDNASRDGSAEAVAERFPRGHADPLRRSISASPRASTAPPRLPRGEALLVLNPDARLCPGALDLLLELPDRHPRAALVGPALRYADGAPQAAAFRFPGLAQVLLDLFPVARLMDSRLNGRVHRAPARSQIDHPLGACMLIRRAAWDDVGPLDEGYFMYLEEIDWCRRARQRGWQIWHQPAAVAIHHGGAVDPPAAGRDVRPAVAQPPALLPALPRPDLQPPHARRDSARPRRVRAAGSRRAALVDAVRRLAA